jgi:transposase
LDVLPTGYIYPREQRAVRDLMRKRSQLVRLRSTQILSMQNLLARNLGEHASSNEIKHWQAAQIKRMPLLIEQQQALQANLAVMHCLDEQIDTLEGSILAKAKLRPDYASLRTVSGIGEVLALTIALETGEIGRFADAGHFASYARTVSSRRESNGKKKGKGNAKCGNKHLAWAFVEAAHFAIRYDSVIRRWYQKKCANTLVVVALKAVAHKLARASFYVMRDGAPFDASKAFG